MLLSHLRAGSLLVLLSLLGGATRAAEPVWTEGKNYFLINPARPPPLPRGQVEVAEAFSYGCPACNAFLPIMRKLQQALPANAVLVYLPAAFNPTEDWPMFSQAFFAAQALGIADQTHDAMFDAVWKTGELAIIDQATQRVKDSLPTIEDAARFYHRVAGVGVEKFVNTAKSFAVDTQMRGAEETLMAYRVDRTPTLIVNGRYRLHAQSAGGNEQMIELTKWLVEKESK